MCLLWFRLGIFIQFYNWVAGVRAREVAIQIICIVHLYTTVLHTDTNTVSVLHTFTPLYWTLTQIQIICIAHLYTPVLNTETKPDYLYSTCLHPCTEHWHKYRLSVLHTFTPLYWTLTLIQTICTAHLYTLVLHIDTNTGYLYSAPLHPCTAH